MKKYKQLTEFKTYSVRDLSRGKTTEAINEALGQPVVIMKNNKPQCVLLSFEEYFDLIKERNNEK